MLLDHQVASSINLIMHTVMFMSQQKHFNQQKAFFVLDIITAASMNRTLLIFNIFYVRMDVVELVFLVTGFYFGTGL